MLPLIDKTTYKEAKWIQFESKVLLVVLSHQMGKVCGQFLLSHANHVPKHEKTQVERYM